MQNNPPSPLSPGHHVFTSQKGLTFEYIIHHPDDDTTTNSSDLDLLIIHCPAWGLGSTYLQAGLQALTTTPPPSSAKATSKGRALLFFHPRGTNNSTFPSDPTKMSSMPDLASDLEDLRLHLGLETFPGLLGHSNGGAIILGYAEMFPTRVDKLILLNRSLIGFKDKRVLDESVTQDERYKDAFRVSSVLSNPETDVEFTEMVRCIWPLYFFDTAFVERLLKDIGGGNMPIDCWRSVYGCDKALEKSRQMVDGLEKVQARTLILYGEDDLICGPGVARRTKEGIRDALLLGYDRCGHFPWIEKREQTMDDIRSFLDTGTITSNMCI